MKNIARSSFLGLTALMLAGCASTPAVERVKPYDQKDSAQRGMMVGTWYGEAPLKEGGQRLWLINRQADGTFMVEFLITEADGNHWRQAEAGIWGYSAGVYFTKTMAIGRPGRLSEVDPTEANYDDTYAVKSLTEDALSIQSLTFGDIFSVKRVPSSFMLPSAAMPKVP